jgi:hypothetical protein
MAFEEERKSGLSRSCWPEGKQQVLRRWLRHAENLSDTKEESGLHCEPEVGETLNDEEIKQGDDQ